MKRLLMDGVSSEVPSSGAWHNRSAVDVLAKVDTSATGLSAQEVARRLTTDGANELKEGIGGLRRTEFLCRRVKDIDLGRCEITIRDGKGGVGVRGPMESL